MTHPNPKAIWQQIVARLASGPQPQPAAGPPDPATPGPRRRWLLNALGVGVVVAAVILLVYPTVRSLRTVQAVTNTSGGQQPAPVTAPPQAPPTLDEVERRFLAQGVSTQSGTKDNQAAVAKVKQRQFLARVEDAQRLATEATGAVAAFDAEAERLLAGGQAVAAVADGPAKFLAAVEGVSRTAAPPDRAVQVLRDLAAPVEKAAADPDNLAVPPAEAAKVVEDTIAALDRTARDFRAAREKLAALARDAGRAGPVPADGGPTLRQAVADYRTARAADHLAKDEALLREAEDAARRASAEREAAARARLIEAEGKAKAAALDAQAGKAAAAAESAGKRAAFERDLPRIRHHLAPFVAPGYAQPNGHANRQAAEKKPVSYSKLASSGALAPDRDGMERLMYLATIGNDRDAGGFPKYTGGDLGWQQADKEWLRTAQELLAAHGEQMVEAGLLSK